QNASVWTVGNAFEAARTEVVASTAGSRLVLVAPTSGQTLDGAVAQLRGRADVQFAEADAVMRIAATTPTDPLYGTYQWDSVKIGLPAAWDRTTGSTAVTVAVVDTGVDATHPGANGTGESSLVGSYPRYLLPAYLFGPI